LNVRINDDFTLFVSHARISNRLSESVGFSWNLPKRNSHECSTFPTFISGADKDATRGRRFIRLEQSVGMVRWRQILPFMSVASMGKREIS